VTCRSGALNLGNPVQNPSFLVNSSRKNFKIYTFGKPEMPKLEIYSSKDPLKEVKILQDIITL
jgi:hypothetical protein